MKQAVWAVDPFGDFAFRGARSGQLSLGLENADFEPLKETLRAKFSGKGWVRIEDIGEYVASDETDYHTNQFKRRALVPMEDAGQIEVLDGTRKKRRTFPDGTQLRFI